LYRNTEVVCFGEGHRGKIVIRWFVLFLRKYFGSDFGGGAVSNAKVFFVAVSLGVLGVIFVKILTHLSEDGLVF
jgi:hypothetical protein